LVQDQFQVSKGLLTCCRFLCAGAVCCICLLPLQLCVVEVEFTASLNLVFLEVIGKFQAQFASMLG
jgi:hypothetical protein